MSIDDKQNEIIAQFQYFSDWEDKYQCIIDLGAELPLIDPVYKTAENLIKGCQSQVWLHAALKDGKVFFTADSDAIIPKGLVALIVSVLSGAKPSEITKADLYFIDSIGFKGHLSELRSNGLLAMVQQMKDYAHIVAALETVFDPEIPVNIVELGLVYELILREAGRVKIMMTLTAPGCPVASDIINEVQTKVNAVAGVTETIVELTFDPPWTKDLMSEEAKLELGFL